MRTELTTTVKIEELIEEVKKNAKRHTELYEEAMIGYRKNLIKAITKKLNAAKEGKDVEHHINVLRPHTYKKDYECLLSMLEMTVDRTMLLTKEQFMQYVKDDWGWKSSFINSCNPHGVKLSDIEGSYLD